MLYSSAIPGPPVCYYNGLSKKQQQHKHKPRQRLQRRDQRGATAQPNSRRSSSRALGPVPTYLPRLTQIKLGKIGLTEYAVLAERLGGKPRNIRKKQGRDPTVRHTKNLVARNAHGFQTEYEWVASVAYGARPAIAGDA